MSEVVAEREVEKTVGSILLVEQRKSGFCLADGKVFLEIEENRLYRVNLGVLNILYKLANLIAVGRDGCNCWLVNLLLERIHALCLEYGDIAISKETVGKCHNLFLRHATHTVEFLYCLFPFCAADEGVHELRYTIAVIVE